MRKIDLSLAADDEPALIPEKKPRKKWTAEETDMLVKGCRLVRSVSLGLSTELTSPKHGVGNWKTILQDTTLSFHDRSAVDLKDRFRTYFSPMPTRCHYPQCPHTFEQQDPAQRCLTGPPFSKRPEASDAAPSQRPKTAPSRQAMKSMAPLGPQLSRTLSSRRQVAAPQICATGFAMPFLISTRQPGYKPRTATKKKVDTPLRAADDQLSARTSAGPVRSRRRAQTTQGLFRGGTKSVPQSTAASEDEDSSAAEEEDSEASAIFKTPPIPVFVDNVSTAPFSSNRKAAGSSPPEAFRMNAESTLNFRN